MNCHNGRRDDPEDRIQSRLDDSRSTGPHHGPQAEMLTTLNVWTWDEILPTSPHLVAAVPGGEGNSCVNCHMYEPSPSGHDTDAGMHSFSMVSQEGVDNVAACVDCHGNVGESFDEKKFYINGIADHDGDGVDEGLQHEIEGMLDTLYAALPTDEEGDFVVDSATTSFDVAAAMYNYSFVEEDRSLGIHNPAFTVALMQLSIDRARGIASSIENPELGVVHAYKLSQNYPNPFNPSTQINFSLKAAGMVNLKVYDVLGREVVTLVNDQMTAGEHIVEFDASALASGIYIYRIATANGEFNAMKKMVLIK